MYSRQDAINRVCDARFSSLALDMVNHEYLITLRKELYNWIDAINETIHFAKYARNDEDGGYDYD